MPGEVADDGVDVDARVPAGQRGGRLDQRRATDIHGHEAPEGAARWYASSKVLVLSLVPEPSSTTVSTPVVAAISSAWALRIERSASVG